MIPANNTLTVAKDNSLTPDFQKQKDELVPVIVQEYTFGRRGKVLMLAYANKEAYELTLKTGLAHFWSRSRKELWKKGTTSGNLLEVREIFLDCDQDTLIYLVIAPRVVCHLGKSECFSRKAWLHIRNRQHSHEWSKPPMTGVHQEEILPWCIHCGKEKPD